MFTGNEDQTISLSQGSKLTKNYRDANPGTETTLGHYISSWTMNKILNQDNCVGVRIYYALDDDGEKQLVMTGVDAAGNDLYEGVLGDRTFRCPPYNGATNPLNS